MGRLVRLYQDRAIERVPGNDKDNDNDCVSTGVNCGTPATRCGTLARGDGTPATRGTFIGRCLSEAR